MRAPTHAAPSALPSKTLSTHTLLHPLHCAHVHKWLWLPVVSITACLACVCPQSLQSRMIGKRVYCVIVWPAMACPQSVQRRIGNRVSSYKFLFGLCYRLACVCLPSVHPGSLLRSSWPSLLRLGPAVQGAQVCDRLTAHLRLGRVHGSA